MKLTQVTTAAFLLIANPALAHHDGSHQQTTINNQGGNATSGTNVNNANNINYPQQVPNIVGPVPPNYVPVLSIYGQLDNEQKGVYGAQISFPLQFR